MRFPKRIRIGWKTFKVKHVHDECDALGADGLFLSDQRRISIKPGLAHDHECEVVLHEVLHGIMDVARLKFPSDDDEENIVQAITGPLLETLRSNSDLVRYLTKE